MPQILHPAAYPADDAPRDATYRRVIQVGAKEFSLNIPNGYSLITKQELQTLHDQTSAKIARVREMASEDIKRYEAKLLALADVIANQQSQMERHIAARREANAALKQARACIARPFKWLFLALLNRAISSERAYQFAALNSELERKISTQTT